MIHNWYSLIYLLWALPPLIILTEARKRQLLNITQKLLSDSQSAFSTIRFQSINLTKLPPCAEELLRLILHLLQELFLFSYFAAQLCFLLVFCSTSYFVVASNFYSDMLQMMQWAMPSVTLWFNFVKPWTRYLHMVTCYPEYIVVWAVLCHFSSHRSNLD